MFRIFGDLMLPHLLWASLVAQLVKNPTGGDSSSILQLGSSPRRDSLQTPIFLGFLGGSDGKEYACSARDLGLIPGDGNGYTAIFLPGEFQGQRSLAV